MKIDLHVHTDYSEDSILSIDKLVKSLRVKKIDAVAITDHNSIKGALKAKKMWPDKVIVGEEVKTDKGEISGLFLNEQIPKDLSLEEAIDRIKEQDGIVYVPHPFDRLRRKKLDLSNSSNWKTIWKDTDAIEVFNSRTVFDQDNKKALKFARKNKKNFCCGSDAHTDFEVGNAFVRIDEFDSKREFLKNLAKAKVCGKKSSVLVHAITKIVKVLK